MTFWRCRHRWLGGCIAGWALLMMLGACSDLPRTGLPENVVFDPASRTSGRLALRIEGDAQRSFSADFELEGRPEAGRLTLNSPLGTRLALAQWQPGRVWLSNGDGVHEFDSLDALGEAALGERIPLVALYDWLAGRPWPGAPSQGLTTPAEGFRQLGWEVRLAGYPQGLLVATRLAPPVVSLRAKIDSPVVPPATADR
ncbi:MAG: lipoprotein insertase outer membrane protein LolB [Burkholderiales bacterium]